MNDHIDDAPANSRSARQRRTCKVEPAPLPAVPTESDAAREKRLEKNRRSARRHRAKVKSETELLLERTAELEATKAVLEAKINCSERTIVQLRSALEAVLGSSDESDSAGGAEDSAATAAAALLQLSGPPLSAHSQQCSSPSASHTPHLDTHDADVPARLVNALTRLGLPESAPRTTGLLQLV
jgi:hypothetical protein